jgi:predicted small lipoprotein YifL
MLASPQLKSTLVACTAAALLLSLAGCGGGGGGAPGSSAKVDPLPNQTAAEVPQTTVNFDAGLVSAGWTYTSGVSLYTAASNTWVLQNNSGAGSTSVSATPNGGSDYVYALQYNLGCSTASIVLRTQDCRNVPSFFATLDRSKTASPNAAVSFYARNAEASAQFALRITDGSGQTLQYPFSTRSIESQDPSQWVRITVPLRYPSGYWGGNNNGIPQGGLRNVEVVASSFNSGTPTIGLNYPVGKIEVKGIEWIDSLSTTYKLATNNAVKVNGYESYAPMMAVAHNNFNVTALNKAKSVGFNIIRKDIYWSGVEQNGAFNFTTYTSGLDTLNALNMKALWILDYTHPDHGGSLPPQSPSDVAAFAAYAKKVAQLTAARPNVVGYEVWNEPNLAGSWTSPDPVKYGTLLDAARTSIRQADTVTPVISGGITIDEPNYLFQLAQTGALNSVTAIGVHPYRPDIITTTSPSYQRLVNTPENYAADIIVSRNALASLGVTTPMWNTEWGYSTVFFLDSAVYGDGNSVAAANRQGLLTLRMVLTQLAIKSPLITIFDLVDQGTVATDKEHHFGLLKPDLTEKPAYTGLKTLYQHSSNRAFKGFLTDVPAGMHVLRWDGSTDRTFCAWVDDQGKPVTLNLPASARRVTRWDGTVLTPTSNGDGSKSVAMTEETGPVFVLF